MPDPIPIPAGATIDGASTASGTVPIPRGATIGGMPMLPAKYGGDILKPRPSMFRRNAGPIAAQTAGQLIGEAAGAALAPETFGLSEILPLALGAAGAGLGNVAANKLPEKYGGTPGESNEAAFLWGAIPAGVGGAATRAIGARMATKAAKATAEDAAAFATKVMDEAKRQRGILAEGIQGERPTRATVARAGRLIGSPTGEGIAPLEGEERTSATNEAINAVSGPIERMAAERGKPIGEAYKSLKGGDQFLTEQQAGELADAAKSVKAELISPAPKAEKTFKRLLEYNLAPANSEVLSKRIELPGGEVIEPSPATYAEQVRARGLETQEHLKRLGLMPKGAEIEPPPTYDELRDLRQRLEAKARTAIGGDRYALRSLQHRIDKVLVDRLPDNMGTLRNSYKGFIKNYERLTPLRRAGTPEQVGNWLFTREPSVTNEIIRNATPEERETYRQLFAQKVLSKIDPEATGAEQHRILKHELVPYLKNNTARLLFGDQTRRVLSDIVHLPGHLAAAASDLKSPKGIRAFDESFAAEANRTGKAGLEAATAGYNKWFRALPPETQAAVSKIAQPLSPAGEVPTLPSPAESLAQRLKTPKHVYMPQFVSRYAIGAALGSAAGFASGGDFMIRAAIGFGTMAGTAAGYNAMMKAGGADLIAKMYSRPAARFLGAAAFKALVNLGGRAAHEAMRPDEESTNASAR